MRLVLQPVGNYLVVVAIVTALVVLLYAAPPGDKVTGRRRRVLLGLRLLTILMTLLALLRPTLVHMTIEKQPATLVVLADRSRSMSIDDAAGKKTRWQALRTALDDAKPALRRLAEEIEVRAYTFDSDLHAVTVEDGAIELDNLAAGRQTAIGAALDDMLRLEAGKRLAAVVLLTDGAQRALPPRDLAPQTPARRLADLTFPLYTVPLGQTRGSDQSRDVAVENFLPPPAVYVKNKLTVTALVRADGYVNQPIPVQLLYETKPGKMEPVAAVQVSSHAFGTRVPVELDYTPTEPGEHKIMLRATPQPGELIVNNNEVSTFVTVLSGGLNVLYLEGAPRTEAKFLRRSLDSSPDIKVDFLRLDAQRPETKPADFADRFRPGRYNVYVLGDLDSAVFSPEEITGLVDCVKKGAGFIMLGGFHSFGPGGYGRTALANVLPITIDRLERQNFGEPIRADLHLRGQPRFVPTPLGLQQGFLILTGNRERNLAMWRELPPLEGANAFRSLKPSAKVLAESPTAGEPLMVGHNFEQGRVLAFAGDSTWRWWMAGHESTHKRFWRQTILWLAKMDAIGEGRVKLALEQRRYAPGGRVEFTVRAETAEGAPQDDATFTAEVERPHQPSAAALLRRHNDETQGTFVETAESGDYLLRVTGYVRGEAIGMAQARFLVYEQDLEMDNTSADRALLENLSATTGGRALAPEELPSLFEELLARVAKLEIETEIKRTLWDTWPFFAIFIFVLTAEWYLRKKWGLV
jgi:uncharacterized membrane protein